MDAASSPPAAWRALPGLAKANLAVLAAFGLLLCGLLWPAWRHDPDVSHGLFMPIIFIFLLHRSRRAGPARYLAGGAGNFAAVVVFSAVGVGLIVLAGLYAAALDWSNSLVDCLFATAYASLLFAALIAGADRRIRLLPFNWISVMAVALWPLASPIPPGTYTRLTVGLQLWVSTGVMEALHLLGVVAFRQGNVIQLATTSVGVAEACSGVRSLVSCVFVGLFFSAGLVTRPKARVLIVALAAPLALAMNFIRSLTLTLLANAGVAIEGAWHDATGFAVLGATIVLLGGLALFLERGARPSLAPGTGRAAKALRWGASQSILAAAAGASALLVLFFYVNTRPGVKGATPVPNLLAILPESPDGWSVATRSDLYQFAGVLQTDVLAERTYQRSDAKGAESVTIYLAYWRPGQASVSLVATHTPDACWPGAGWVAQPLSDSRVRVSMDGHEIPDGESRLFTHDGYSRYVLFWHLYDGRPIPYLSPHSLGPLLRLAWTYGFRHDGDQVFVRVSSNRPWSEIGREALLHDFIARLQPLGL